MNRLLYLAVLVVVWLVPAAFGQLPPEKAAKTFQVVDGLEMSLWASEPLFTNPTCIDIDHRGKVWVCEAVNYRNRLHGKKTLNRPEGDRIVILEDTKGTGRADKAITFYQAPDFIAPLGIAVAAEPSRDRKGAFSYKVYVCHSPHIYVFEDKDGDGKADGPPKKLLTGFGGYDSDHGVHGILIGPDGKLYFSVGDTGVHGLQSSDGKGRKWHSNDTDCRAGTIWRCDLDGKNLELIAHNFRNEYEPCVDSFGTVFVSDNDDDGNQQTRICYVMPGGNYGYHPRGPGQSHWHEEQPGVVPKILRTGFGSPTGMCVYEGTLLPKKYWGQLLHTDAGPRHVRCYHLKPKGAGYDVDREDMVTSSDNWFRPSDICVAPDGSVFVADWYDPGVGGHGMGDTTRGRIYRLAPKGHKYRMPKIDLSGLEILDVLGSPNRAVRYMALAKLKAMKPAQLFKVMELAVIQKENVWLTARGFWQVFRTGDLAQLHNMQIPVLLNLTPRADERLPVQAIRMLGEVTDEVFRHKAMTGPHAISLFGTDFTSAMNREILLALRHAEPEAARSDVFRLAKHYDGKDRFYLEAIGIAVGRDPKRHAIILADFAKEFPDWNDKVAGLVWELRPPDMIPVLEKRLGDAKVPASQRAQIVDILAASEDRNAGARLLQTLQTDAPAEMRERIIANLKLFLPGKWRNLRQSKELNEAITNLLAKADSRPRGLSLIAVARRMDQLDTVSRMARSKDETAATRTAAIQTLGALPSQASVDALQALLHTDDAALRSQAVQALGQLAQHEPNKPGAAAAMKALQELVRHPDRDGTLAAAALSALAGTYPGTQWLLDLHAKKALPAALRGDTARLLRNSPFQGLRNRALIAFPPPARLNPKKLPSIAALVTRKGDAQRGKELMALSAKNDLQCLKCHTIRGSGGQIGPDLSLIGKKASKENLLESILFPSKAIADQYLTWQIETKKGLSLTGLIVEETPNRVTLRDGNGKDTKIDKKDIESREKSPKSLMPDDLLAYMTEEDLLDMVAYLLELKEN